MSIQFLSPSFQTTSPNLYQRACQNLEAYKKNRRELLSCHLDMILKDIEKIILRESLFNGKGSIEYDISSVAVAPTTKVSNEKPTDAEFNTLITEVLQWLRKENLTVKQQFERSMCANLRTKMTISWSPLGGGVGVGGSGSSCPPVLPNSSLNPYSEDRSKQFERALPVLMTFPVKQMDEDL
jgi:hypothetical protein